MEYPGRSGALAATSVILISLVLAVGAASAQGVSREKGEFWTYEMTVLGEVMGMRAELSGEVTYTVRGETYWAAYGTGSSATVIGLDGSLNGQVYVLDQAVGEADIILSGTQHELASTPGVLEENITTISDVAIGAGAFSFIYHLQKQVVVTASPPVLAELDPGRVNVGDMWTRTVELLITSKTWENGSVANTSITNSSLTYQSAVTATESMETPSGVYTALVVEVSDSAGNIDIYWWSAEVDNFVKHEVYENGSELPTVTMVLADYGSTVSSDMTGYIVAGVVIFVVGAAVLALVVVRKRPEKP